MLVTVSNTGDISHQKSGQQSYKNSTQSIHRNLLISKHTHYTTVPRDGESEYAPTQPKEDTWRDEHV